MSDKTVKDAVEHFGGVWPDCDFLFVYYKDSNAEIFDRIERETDDFFSSDKKFVITKTPLTHTGKLSCGPRFIVEKQQFEDYVRENEMEKQKYKYVPATGMDIWDLGKEISLGATYFDECNNSIYIDDSGCLKTVRWDQGGLSRKLEELQITYRKPLQWFEIKDNYPCLASISYDTGKCSPVLLHDIDEFKAYNEPHNHIRVVGIRFVIRLCDIEGYCTPLSPEQAAKYGVECDQ